MTIQEVIDRICAFHPPVDQAHTCDTIKIGNPYQECTGIAVTCFASVKTALQAKELGANLLICHEPVFFSDPEPSEVLTTNSVYSSKRKLLDELGLVVWRDHDHIHGEAPNVPCEQRKTTDGIFYGIMKLLGWEAYLVSSEKKPLLFDIPEVTVSELAHELEIKMNLNGMRIVGDTTAKVSRVFICEHAFGNGDEYIIQKAEAFHADVLIPLEIVDWTVSEYVRDACALGRPMAILEMGHFNFEEAGMKYMAQWLPDVVGESCPTVQYLQSGDAFSYHVRNAEKA